MNAGYSALSCVVLLLLAVAQPAMAAERLKPAPAAPSPPAVLQKSTISIPSTVTTGPLKLTGVAQGGQVPAPNVPATVTTGPLRLTGVAQGGQVPAPNVPATITTGPLKLTGAGQ